MLRLLAVPQTARLCADATISTDRVDLLDLGTAIVVCLAQQSPFDVASLQGKFLHCSVGLVQYIQRGKLQRWIVSDA